MERNNSEGCKRLGGNPVSLSLARKPQEYGMAPSSGGNHLDSLLELGEMQ